MFASRQQIVPIGWLVPAVHPLPPQAAILGLSLFCFTATETTSADLLAADRVSDT